MLCLSDKGFLAHQNNINRNEAIYKLPEDFIVLLIYVHVYSNDAFISFLNIFAQKLTNFMQENLQSADGRDEAGIGHTSHNFEQFLRS